jgi:tetratricopeptide (TPR) repeat protein
MQQRVASVCVPRLASRRVCERLLAAAALCFSLASLIGNGGQAEAQASGTPGNADLPTVMLVIERLPHATPQQDDLNSRLKTTLRETLAHSGRFQVHSFLPTENIIKRALNEHLIASDDLAEPLKAEGLQRIAKAIGARFILQCGSTLDRLEVRTDMRYMQNPNVADWIVLAGDHMSVPLTIGRKRLKPDDIVNLTVDSITARIGIPTHLAGNLQIMPGSRVIGDNGPKAKKSRNDRAATAAPKTAPPDNTGTDQVAAKDPDSTDGPNPTKGPPSKPGKNQRSAAVPKSDVVKPTAGVTHNDMPVGPVFTNEADPARAILPAQPAIAPPPVAPRPDYEAQALRYRQTGDLSNAVVALRRAVNERPRDVGLRRQLIQVYQTRQMPEAAHAEALRALQMDSTSAALYRLYGEVLMAQGDLDGAMRAFRDGTRVDPADIACQLALGDAQLTANHFVLALEAYDAASKSDTKSPLPHRRIGRALAARAGTELDQYQASLAELRRAQELTPASDTTSYLDDYVGIMRIVEGRVRDMLEELQAANQARVQGKLKETELHRQIAELKLRGLALADYLDKLPAAPGHDVTQAHYTQANAHLLQAVGFFKDVVDKGDDRFADSMKSGQVQAQRELTIASQRLIATKNPSQ